PQSWSARATRQGASGPPCYPAYSDQSLARAGSPQWLPRSGPTLQRSGRVSPVSGIVRSQLQRAFRVGQPLRCSASFEIAPSAVVIGTWVRWVELNGRIEIGDGAFAVAVLEIRGAAAVVALGVGWPDLDRLVVVSYSLVVFALAEV